MMRQSAIETSGENSSIGSVFQPQASEQHMLVAAKGGGITFAGKLFTFACRLVLTLVLARLMGATQYGLYNLALTALTAAAVLSSLGLDSAAVRFVALFAHRRDQAGIWGTLQLSLGVTALVGSLLGIGLFALAHPIALRIFNAPQLVPLLQVASPIVPFLGLSLVAAAATQGFKKMQYATLSIDVIQPLIRVVLVLVLLVIGLSAVNAIVAYGIAIAISCLMLIYFLHQLFPFRSLRDGRRDTGPIFGYSLTVFASDMMTTFRENIQTFLLGALNTITSVGIYAVVNQINLIGHMFHTAVTTATKPVLAELYDGGAYAEMGRLYQTTTKWSFTFNLPLFLVLVIFPAQVLSIFGKSFVGGSTALILLALANMADVGTGTCGAVIDMSGYAKLKLFNSIVRVVLAIGLSILLIPSMGILGAAIATLVVVGTVNVLRLMEVFWLFRLLPYNRTFFKPITAGLAGTLATLAVAYWLPAQTNLIATAICVTVLCAVYVGTLLLLGLSAEDRTLLRRVRQRLNRKFGGR